MAKPNILYIMCDQLRADVIGALGNSRISTPNIDRLVKRGVAFTNAYSSCPVCVPARYTVRTGCEPKTTGIYNNGGPSLTADQPKQMEKRCGDYLARTLGKLGYRTFGVGKFHCHPDQWEDIGYDKQLWTEEIMGDAESRRRDSYSHWIDTEHPQFSYIEQLHGERSDMYYIPQCSPLPKELTVESYVADRAVEFINEQQQLPWFAFVSFVGPHPPLAPPVPFNRMYNPLNMPASILGDVAVDHMDEQIPCMNYAVWADQISPVLNQQLWARYYGEISYIDWCMGRILDAVEKRPDVDNTLIAFFADHGDHMGDHHAWQKESFFEQACHVPFLVSWPAKLDAKQKDDQLVCLADLFGIATTAAGSQELRDGWDVLGAHKGTAPKREAYYGTYGVPGTSAFKVMIRWHEWKLIYLSNGGRVQLFNLLEDTEELHNQAEANPKVKQRLLGWLIEEMMKHPSTKRAVKDNALIAFEFVGMPRSRMCQFAYPGPVGKFYPDDPKSIYKEL